MVKVLVLLINLQGMVYGTEMFVPTKENTVKCEKLAKRFEKDNPSIRASCSTEMWPTKAVLQK